MFFPQPLADSVALRPLEAGDAAALAAAYDRNREHLAPWEPERADAFFTEEHQREEIRRALALKHAGAGFPLVLESAGRIVGRININNIVHGAFESASLGYWIDADLVGGGIMSRAVGLVVQFAREGLQVHRLEAGTLLNNAASQSVLRRNGFREYGVAPSYLRIAGRWQDHRLFQLLLH